MTTKIPDGSIHYAVNSKQQPIVVLANAIAPFRRCQSRRDAGANAACLLLLLLLRLASPSRQSFMIASYA